MNGSPRRTDGNRTVDRWTSMRGEIVGWANIYTAGASERSSFQLRRGRAKRGAGEGRRERETEAKRERR